MATVGMAVRDRIADAFPMTFTWSLCDAIAGEIANPPTSPEEQHDAR